MKIEKIKAIASILSFIVIVIIGVFFTKSSEETFAEFLQEYYKCIIVEKPAESTTNRGLYVYGCSVKNKISEIGINSRLFHKIISIGDTVEKIKNTGTFIIKKKKSVLKLTLIHTQLDKLDTLMVR